MDEDKKRKKLRKQRIRKRRLQILKRVLITIIIVAGVVSAAGAIFVNVFKVKTVTFSGNTWNSDEEMKSYIFTKEYDNNTIIAFLKNKYMQKAQIPYVETYEVKVNWPSDLVINVYEKKIIGYLSTPIGNMYFDKDGIIVDKSQEILKTVPKLSGVDTENIVLHKEVVMPSAIILPAVLEIKQQLDKYGLEVEEILFDDDYNIDMKAGDITISLGQAEYLTEKVFEYSQLSNELAGMKGILHLENCTGQAMNIHFTPE